MAAYHLPMSVFYPGAGETARQVKVLDPQNPHNGKTEPLSQVAL